MRVDLQIYRYGGGENIFINILFPLYCTFLLKLECVFVTDVCCFYIFNFYHFLIITFNIRAPKISEVSSLSFRNLKALVRVL